MKLLHLALWSQSTFTGDTKIKLETLFIVLVHPLHIPTSKDKLFHGGASCSPNTQNRGRTESKHMRSSWSAEVSGHTWIWSGRMWSAIHSRTAMVVQLSSACWACQVGTLVGLSVFKSVPKHGLAAGTHLEPCNLQRRKITLLRGSWVTIGNYAQWSAWYTCTPRCLQPT